MEIVQDLDRPDTNGIPAKMQAIADKTKQALTGITPVLNIHTNDNLMSFTLAGQKNQKINGHTVSLKTLLILGL